MKEMKNFPDTITITDVIEIIIIVAVVVAVITGIVVSNIEKEKSKNQITYDTPTSTALEGYVGKTLKKLCSDYPHLTGKYSIVYDASVRDGTPYSGGYTNCMDINGGAYVGNFVITDINDYDDSITIVARQRG